MMIVMMMIIAVPKTITITILNKQHERDCINNVIRLSWSITTAKIGIMKVSLVRRMIERII